MRSCSLGDKLEHMETDSSIIAQIGQLELIQRAKVQCELLISPQPPFCSSLICPGCKQCGEVLCGGLDIWPCFVYIRMKEGHVLQSQSGAWTIAQTAAQKDCYLTQKLSTYDCGLMWSPRLPSRAINVAGWSKCWSLSQWSYLSFVQALTQREQLYAHI